VIVVLDTCTFINLANGGVLHIVLQLPDVRFQLGSSVKRESTSVARVLDEAVGSGLLDMIDDSSLSAVRFAALKTRFRLGDGETECLLAAETLGHVIACDDSSARRAAADLFGVQRLTGSIGLIKKCVHEGLMSPEDGFSAYLRMKDAGGFLPPQTLQEFAQS
jgi:predicted nucleic acid-binding protein